jgi:ribosomal protein S18 acetylase RimI-like enzyme
MGDIDCMSRIKIKEDVKRQIERESQGRKMFETYTRKGLHIFLSYGITCQDFNKLRESVGWDKLDPEATKKAIQNTLSLILVKTEDGIAGMGRVIGDGVYFYLQDVVVKPEFQSKGVGDYIVKYLISHVLTSAPSMKMFCVLCPETAKEFYKKHGFELSQCAKDYGAYWFGYLSKKMKKNSKHEKH